MALWERYVDSQVDYRASAETLGRKLAEAGTDCWQVLEWLRAPEQAQRAAGPQAQLLWRVLGEQFEVVGGSPVPLAKQRDPVLAEGTPAATGTPEAMAGMEVNPTALGSRALPDRGETPSRQLELGAPAAENTVQIEPKGKGQLSSDRVQNPHEPEATYGVNGEGQKNKEPVGFKIQVAETCASGVGARRADAQFYCADGHPSGLRE